MNKDNLTLNITLSNGKTKAYPIYHLYEYSNNKYLIYGITERSKELNVTKYQITNGHFELLDITDENEWNQADIELSNLYNQIKGGVSHG